MAEVAYPSIADALPVLADTIHVLQIAPIGWVATHALTVAHHVLALAPRASTIGTRVLKVASHASEATIRVSVVGTPI